MARVSVIIPAYNRARLLPEAVNSVLAQTYQDFELIVIDDGSTDDTPEVARAFPPSVKYFRQANAGLSAVRNRGVELTKGDYIVFLDSDDALLDHALEKGVAFLDQHPEVAFCHGQVYTIDENSRPLRLRRPRGPKRTCVRDGREEIAHLLLFRNIIGPSATFVRRSCLEKAGPFNTALSSFEDWDMWVRLAKRYAVGHLAEPVALYRVHSQSITARFDVESVKSLCTGLMESVLEDAELGPLFAPMRKRARFALYCYLAKVAGQKGRFALGTKFLLKALVACPELLFRREGISLIVNAARGFAPPRLKSRTARVLRALRLW